MKRTLTALTLAASLIASGAYAFDGKTLRLLKNLSVAKTDDLTTGNLKVRNEKRERLRLAQEDWEKNRREHGIGLSSAYLDDIYLGDINLSGADLSDANLSGTNLEGADLSDANLKDANLDGANLDGANLKDAKMKGAILCNTIMPAGFVIYSGCR